MNEKWSFKSPVMLMNGVMYRVREHGDTLDQAVKFVAKKHNYTAEQECQLDADCRAMLKLAGEKGARDAGVI